MDFKKEPKKGKFIVFEGVDHSGKTTQINRAEKYLKSKGRSVLRLREPGGTDIGEKIRELLLDKANSKMSPKAEFCLFFAARAQLVDEKIMPAIKSGQDVLLDRYVYSTAAYQGAAGVRTPVGIVAFSEEWLMMPIPDLVFFLDGDPEVLGKRHRGEKDRLEAKGLEYQKQVRQCYHQVFGNWPGPYQIVNAQETMDEVHSRIRGILNAQIL
jgi:dTMP kinase